MTTAHRPTWKAAVGRAQEGGWTAGGAVSTSKSALDMAAHTKLKLRTGDQVVDRQQALKESLLKLEQAEQKALIGRRQVNPQIEQQGQQRLLKQTADIDNLKELQTKYQDQDAKDDDDNDDWSDIDRQELDNESDLDASSDEDEDSDDSEDEEAALQAELAKIRAERAAAQQEKEAAEAAQEEAKQEEAALLGNPLLATVGSTTTGKLKRRWNDDVVFRNQAKDEPRPQKRFINDTVRNDFHKRFLDKFIR